MEYEDRFHPNESNDLENDIKNMMAQIRSIDKGFHRLKRDYDTPNGKKTMNTIIYSSGDIGSNIRNAITGQHYVDKVGSINESNYFKIIISTGEIKGDRRTFFFISPEDYERHMHITLNTNVKEQWNRNRNKKME